MEYLRRHGYPVPAVEEVGEDGSELVMERIDGLSMGDFLRKRPWMIHRQGAVLAGLHRRLHEIPPPDTLRAASVAGFGCRPLAPIAVRGSPRRFTCVDARGKQPCMKNKRLCQRFTLPTHPPTVWPRAISSKRQAKE